jgi:hypothetical protein
MSMQKALAISESPREYSFLLLRILQFFKGSPKELSKLRETASEFKRCADHIIRLEITNLVGSSIRPIQGQSNGELLDAAMQMDRVARRWLRYWHANTSRADGFDVGLIGNYTRKKCNYDHMEASSTSSYVIALVPCTFSFQNSASEPTRTVKVVSSVPVMIELNKKIVHRGGQSIIDNMAYLPRKFLHMNTKDNGEFYVKANAYRYQREGSLDSTLRRIQRDLESPPSTTLSDSQCVLAVILHSQQHGGSENLYNEYYSDCLKLFHQYQLGHRLPSLDILEKAIENELRIKTMKKLYVEKMDANFKEASLKLSILERKVEKKFWKEEVKRNVHLFFVLLFGSMALIEKFNLHIRIRSAFSG